MFLDTESEEGGRTCVRGTGGKAQGGQNTRHANRRRGHPYGESCEDAKVFGIRGSGSVKRRDGTLGGIGRSQGNIRSRYRRFMMRVVRLERRRGGVMSGGTRGARRVAKRTDGGRREQECDQCNGQAGFPG